MRTQAESLATRLRRLREARGLSTRQLAGAAGFSQGVVTHLETGRTRDPRLETLRALAAALGVGLEDLAGE